jgi:hypothetical protein
MKNKTRFMGWKKVVGKRKNGAATEATPFGGVY